MDYNAQFAAALRRYGDNSNDISSATGLSQRTAYNYLYRGLPRRIQRLIDLGILCICDRSETMDELPQDGPGGDCPDHGPHSGEGCPKDD